MYTAICIGILSIFSPIASLGISFVVTENVAPCALAAPSVLQGQRPAGVQRPVAQPGWNRGPCQGSSLQDARYVIHTITFFAVSCPENSAFFRKNRQFFEKIPRKILHNLKILETCCILEKSRKNLVKFGKICENLEESSKKFSNF